MKNGTSFKLLSTFLVLMLLIGLVVPVGVSASQLDTDLNITRTASTQPSTAQGEMKGIWFSYLEFETMLKGKSESEFTKNIKTAFDNVKNYGLNTVFVQVRPYGDAIYKSSYFPWSYIAAGKEGVDPGFDPLAIMVNEAHSRGLRIEAWINPYRIRNANYKNGLSSDNYASKCIKENDRAVIQYDGLISYNPACTNAQDLIVNGVREIVKNYKVDGIHIDDYFYPTMAAGFDKVDYDDYKANSGTLSHADWRRSNVETLLKKMYSAIKAENPNVLFGISPQSNIDRNYSEHYLDIKKITANTGYCDYVCPQIYFGMDHKTQPFKETMDKWTNVMQNSKVKLYVGLASYKIGTVDSYAGAGKNEWVNNSDRMLQMVSCARNAANYNGFILYRYDHVFNPSANVIKKVSAEKTNLSKII